MASTPAPRIQFTRRYLLSEAGSTNGGFGQISTQANAAVGTFTLTDLPAAEGTDDPNVLGDVPNDTMRIVERIGSSTSVWPNTNNLGGRNYFGKIADDGGIVGVIPSTTPSRPGTYFLYTNTVYEGGASITVEQTSFVLCFASGTRILTTRGEVAVEDLRIGDTAVTASGARRPITWTGHRQLGSDSRPMPADQAPVRVHAGAFGRGRPNRDLWLSPGHPVLVGADADNEGGVLVPVMCLINGTSIARTEAASVTYWHVELDAHDILLAEGLPAESFLDFGCRSFFTLGSLDALHNPDFVAPGLSGRCRPVVTDGPQVAAERARLDGAFAQTLAEACAWADGVDGLIPSFG